MSVNAVDNTNLTNYRDDIGTTGFVPSVTYAVSGSNVTVTDASTIPSGDTFKKTHVRLLDDFGGEVRGTIDVTVGGFGYTSAPTVAFSGGGGSGAAGTAVISNGKVVSVTITAPGSSYETAPTVAFTGGGGQGAQGTVVLAADAVGSVTLTAPAAEVVISSSTLNATKGLKLMATVLTTGQRAADGNAVNIGASGSLSNWDTQKNA